MTFTIKNPAPRRAVLRGALRGAAIGVALPFLDCFLNENGTALASEAPLPVRFGTWFWGLGHTPGRGIAETGPEITFLEECQPLNPYKNYINYYSKFATLLDGKPGGVHFTAWVAARTGFVPRGREITEPTLDTIIGDKVGAGSRFRSIDVSATGDPQDSYTYRTGGIHNTAEVSPVALYARIFGPGFADPNKADFKPDPEVMVRQSVLSAVMDEAKDFSKSIGNADRARLDEYFTSVRQVENQLELQLQKPPPNKACRVPERPKDVALGVEIPTLVPNHAILTKILAMAVACNQTKIFNMLYSQSIAKSRPPGQSFTHHTLTHEEPIDFSLGYQRQCAELNVVSMEALATFIQAFLAIREGDGTLLDNTLIYASTDTNDAKLHGMDGIPTMTIGKAGGRMKTGVHILGNGAPTTQVGLTAMQVMGLPIERWGIGSMQVTKPITSLMI